ncbi:MAG: hypothetical protein HRU28_13475 [Rhizobiales bacterium]|nr:hypothetical protein [Hyphomicrobiales bacterium]
MPNYTIITTCHASEVTVDCDTEDEALELAAEYVINQTMFDIINCPDNQEVEDA